VLVQTGAEYLIVLEGNADFLIPPLIGNPAEVVTVKQVIQGHRQIIDRAHALGLKVYGGTLNPVEGYPFPGLWSPDLEEKRQAVNRWIRTSKACDAVIDFDKVLRDPSHPTRLLPDYDSGDHVHPNDTGYRVMADAIDLSLFCNDGGGVCRSLEDSSIRLPATDWTRSSPGRFRRTGNIDTNSRPKPTPSSWIPILRQPTSLACRCASDSFPSRLPTQQEMCKTIQRF
jgi:hypothetical protein